MEKKQFLPDSHLLVYSQCKCRDQCRTVIHTSSVLCCYIIHPTFPGNRKKVHCYRTLFQASLITAPSVTNYPCSTKTLYKLGVASDTKAEKFSAVKWVLICTWLTFIRYAFKLSTLRNEVSLSTWYAAVVLSDTLVPLYVTCIVRTR